ncbi:uncharacterized protein FIBRA_08806 [Fibroporia radiculosa]|uniref:Integral membrane protein n=1 Tax=Fibroporia radiculosa TaxID=599839 RepID=J4GIA2_9APHY|nr:uncharacterized protein FIBRA_08806 [Fibroporia radiculosa]CCM06533.1 predicted protein [Fibroporia radiculosa]
MTEPDLHIDSSIGAFYIGIVIATQFYGIACGQVLYYLWHYPKDSIKVKCSVVLLWVFDTVITIMAIMCLYGYTVQSHSQPSILHILLNSFTIEYTLAIILITAVQCYYMTTIWKLLARKWYKLPLIIAMVILALISLGCGFATAYEW